jgi:hypothetical protein
MSYQEVRRRRRRRLLVMLAVVAVIAGAIVLVTRLQSQEQVRREYLDHALAFADGEADLAERLSDMVLRLEQIGRPGMVSVLEDLQAETATLARDLEELGEPPAELQESDRYLVIAAERWRDGIAAVRAGLIGLTEDPTDEDSRDRVSAGLVDLMVGDSAFTGFLEGLEEGDTEVLGREFPAVAFVPAGGESLFDADALATRLSTPGLEVAENVGVAELRLDPEAVGESVGLPVVPAADSLDAEVVVANNGTVRAANILVTLELVSRDAPVVSFEETVGVLEPGALTTVVFLDLPAPPGGLYEIVVTVSPEDEDPSDNVYRFTFIRNAE